MKRSIAHLRSWVKANKIKTEFHNDMLSESCMPSILELYGSHHDLLEFLIQHSPKQTLDEIYKILQNALEIHRMESLNDKRKQISTNNNNSKPSKVNMNRISTTSIETICGFLTRDSILNFKACNRAIGIICLNEMTKSSITICYASQLLNNKLKPYEKCIMRLDYNISSYNRYNANTTYASILPQLVLNSSTIAIAIHHGKHRHLISNHRIYPTSSLIIFNKSNITWMTRHSNDMNTFVAGEHFILALHYFDVNRQNFILIKYLIIDRHINLKRLAAYIINTLIPSDTNALFTDLRLLLTGDTLSTKMEKLRFYFIQPDIGWAREASSLHFLKQVFSSRNNAKIVSFAFDANIEVDLMQKFEHEISTLTVFSPNIFHLFDRILKTPERLDISCSGSALNELKHQMKHCMTLTNQSRTVIDDTLRSLDDLETGIPIEYDQRLHQNILKYYISRHVLNNVVDAKNITLMRRISQHVLHFGIVTYDTITIESGIKFGWVPVNRDIIYNIRLFPESQAPFPFHCHDVLKNPICVDIRMKEKCSTADIVQHLIQIANNPVFNYKFISVEAALNTYGTQFTCYALKRFLYVSDASYYYVLFGRDEDPIYRYSFQARKAQKQEGISLYLVPKWCSSRCSTVSGCKPYRMMIRFAWSGLLFRESDMILDVYNLREHMIGLPLICTITDKDSLKDILDHNPTMQQYNANMMNTFLVKQTNNSRVTIKYIKESERNTVGFSENEEAFVIVTLEMLNINTDQHNLAKQNPFVVNKFDDRDRVT
eukprot:15761_1